MGYMTGIVVAGMLTFGTCTVVIQKLIFSMEGKTKSGEKKEFKKPWFQTEAMFIGMFGCLAVYEVMRCVQAAKRRKQPQHVSETKPLVNSESVRGQPKKGEMARWKQYCIVCTPALCDMCATAMMNVGLLWIAASVWQMLRGSMVIFSALFSKFFLKRELHASHWTGVCTSPSRFWLSLSLPSTPLICPVTTLPLPPAARATPPVRLLSAALSSFSLRSSRLLRSSSRSTF